MGRFFTCLKEETLDFECEYKTCVEVRGVWCTKDCYHPRSHTIYGKRACILIDLYGGIDVCKYSMDMTCEVNV